MTVVSIRSNGSDEIHFEDGGARQKYTHMDIQKSSVPCSISH